MCRKRVKCIFVPHRRRTCLHCECYIVTSLPPSTSRPHPLLFAWPPQDVSVDDVKKELDFCNKAGLRVLGIVENMSGFVCPHCEECTYIFSKGGGEKLAQSQNITFLGRVPIDPQLAECEDEGKSFTSAYVGSQSAVALQSVIQGVVGSIVTAETAQ